MLLKKSAARSISGICLVNNVWFYQLDPDTWADIRSRFSSALRADDVVILGTASSREIRDSDANLRDICAASH